MKKSSIKKLILEALQEVIKENSRSSKINKYLSERTKVSKATGIEYNDGERVSDNSQLSRKSIYNPTTGTDQYGNMVSLLSKDPQKDDDSPYGTIEDQNGNVYWLAEPIKDTDKDSVDNFERLSDDLP